MGHKIEQNEWRRPLIGATFLFCWTFVGTLLSLNEFLPTILTHERFTAYDDPETGWVSQLWVRALHSTFQTLAVLRNLWVNHFISVMTRAGQRTSPGRWKPWPSGQRSTASSSGINKSRKRSNRKEKIFVSYADAVTSRTVTHFCIVAHKQQKYFSWMEVVAPRCTATHAHTLLGDYLP